MVISAAIFVEVSIGLNALNFLVANVVLSLGDDWNFLYFLFNFQDGLWNFNNFSVFGDFEFFMFDWNLFAHFIDLQFDFLCLEYFFLDFPVFYTFWLLAVHNLDSFVTNCYWNLLLNFTNFLLDNRYLIFAHVDLVLGNWLFNLLDLLTNHNFWDWDRLISIFRFQKLITDRERDGHSFDVNVLVLAFNSLTHLKDFNSLMKNRHWIGYWDRLNFPVDDFNRLLAWLFTNSLMDYLYYLWFINKLVHRYRNLLFLDSIDRDTFALDLPFANRNASLLQLKCLNAFWLAFFDIFINCVRNLDNFVNELDFLVPNNDLFFYGSVDVFFVRDVLLSVARLTGSFSDHVLFLIAIFEGPESCIDNIWLVIAIIDLTRATRAAVILTNLDHLRLLLSLSLHKLWVYIFLRRLWVHRQYRLALGLVL